MGFAFLPDDAAALPVFSFCQRKLSNKVQKFKKHTTFISGMDKIHSQLMKLGENMRI